MFKTSPFVSEKVWGYERWIISTHAAGQSTVLSGDERFNGKPLPAAVGEDYPLLVKVIQADDTLSVQVHPDDDYARRVENTYGKTECWYVLGATPGANLVCGLNKNYTKEELAAAISGNRLEDCLRYVPVEKGDFVFIPAGTVHAIRGGLRLLEVQEPSDITYRLYDWGRPREIHVEKGLEVTKWDAPDVVKNFDDVFSCDYFTLEKGSAIGSVEITSDVGFMACTSSVGGKKPETPAVKRGWVSLFILEGAGTITSCDCTSMSVKAEDTIMFRTDEQLLLTPVPGKRIKYMKIM
ncbi:MAG: class I mannose-6-phosphate isomerase [Treponema sp.]|nr:class I mannose-6-phosphate isomerase [Candidatus Treponema caballi]